MWGVYAHDEKGSWCLFMFDLAFGTYVAIRRFCCCRKPFVCVCVSSRPDRGARQGKTLHSRFFYFAASVGSLV